MHGALIADGAEWTIPAYARDMLWVCAGSDAVRAIGARGSFALPAAADRSAGMTLAWGEAAGPVLAQWAIAPGAERITLGWAGTVAIGGFVERLHVREVRGLPVVIAEVLGALLPPGYRRLRTLEDAQTGNPALQAQVSERPEFLYPLIAQAESVLAEYLHHALVSELALDGYAVLAPQGGRWHEVVWLPLLLEEVTLLAPGAH